MIDQYYLVIKSKIIRYFLLVQILAVLQRILIQTSLKLQNIKFKRKNLFTTVKR